MIKGKQDLWQEYKFFDVIEVLDFRGRTPKKLNLDWGGDIPALSANNVKMGKIDYSLTTNFGSEELYSKWMTKGDLEIGDLVLTTEAPAGNVVVISDNKKYILSQRVIGLKPDKTVIDSNYLMYFFMSNYFKNFLQVYFSFIFLISLPCPAIRAVWAIPRSDTHRAFSASVGC